VIVNGLPVLFSKYQEAGVVSVFRPDPVLFPDYPNGFVLVREGTDMENVVWKMNMTANPQDVGFLQSLRIDPYT
jgi:hypothetical protein